MASAARLFPPSPKPAGAPVTPAVRAPTIRFAKAKADKGFASVIAKLQASARKVGQRDPAAKKAAEARAAAKAPPDEKEGGARANQVDDMKDAKVEKPGTGAFLALLRAEIDKVMPKNLDQADKFMQGGEAGQIKGGVAGNVKSQKDAAAGPTEQATRAPPDTGKVEGKEVTPLPAEPAAAAAPVPGAAAMPAPRPRAEVVATERAASADADKKLADAELTPTQLGRANDPRFSSVLTARDQAKQTAVAGTAAYQSREQAALTQARAGASGEAGRGVGALGATRRGAGARTKSRQEIAKEKEAAARQGVVTKIKAAFAATKAKVDAKLSTLEADVMSVFDAGTDAALANLKSGAEVEIARYKRERYSGLDGAGRWLLDKFRDTPPEIKAITERHRLKFTTVMDALAVRVAGMVDRRLAEAKAITAAGQAEVKGLIAKLGPTLSADEQREIGQIEAGFDALKQSIDDKAQDLAEKLAQKYKDASEKADAAAQAINDANKGALKGLADKVGEVLKVLAEFADRVVSLFKKAAGVVKKIIADPIAFLGNLLSAIKQGIAKFVGNIWTHIKKGFMTWLFGELTKAGVEIPSDLSLPSILKLVLGVLGLTWANIRPKVVKKIGARAVSVLEKVVEVLTKLFTSGPAALWEEIKAFVGNLKGMVIDAILDWVVTKVITSAITKIASMFNPAGAIIQAILMVYNVGSWLAANLSRILDFVESVVNSVDRIANGDVGGAASFIEGSLAKMLPILIGFLASLVGLGGLAGKIKSFITKVQAQVGRAVDFVIDKVWNAIKKVVGAIRGGGRQQARPDERTDAQKQADLERGLTEADTLLRDPKKSPEQVKAALPGIQAKHRMVSLTIVTDSKDDAKEVDHIEGEVNPKGKKGSTTKTVDDKKNKLALAAQLQPAPPPPMPVDKKDFALSDDGNNRLFAFYKGGRRYVFIVTPPGRWHPLKDDTAIQEAEKKLREELATHVTDYKELVDKDKPANAPGFDAAGVIAQPNSGGPFLVIGEVKGSKPTSSKQYVPKEKFTALTTNLGGSLEELRQSPERSTVNAALEAGNVVIIIKLTGGIQVGQRASGRKLSTKTKIENAIRKHFKAYLAANFPSIKVEQILKNITIHWYEG